MKFTNLRNKESVKIVEKDKKDWCDVIYARTPK
jgi:hypothetical protein